MRELFTPWYLLQERGGYYDVRLRTFWHPGAPKRRRIVSGPYAGSEGELTGASHIGNREGEHIAQWTFSVQCADGRILQVPWYELEGAPLVPPGHERDEDVHWEG